jgi:hypothetical protein
MDNLILLSTSASLVYFFVKFIEMRFIKKDADPLKGLLKDSLIVLIATYLGGFIVGQVNGQLNSTTGNAVNSETTPAFTGNPEF